HITLTGPSGGGKSTLLRIIAAMISKTSGTLIFDGQPIESYDPIMYRRQVSYCFQQPTLFGETVADNLAFPYQIRKQVMDTQRVVTALNNVGLSERTLHQPIIELSGGERQRVALIRNILFLPKVLLLDEVTAGLDENNKQIVHAWLRQLNEQDHVTTIMITHDATEIAAADQLAKVVAGRLEVHA
ncbi:TPA: ATP-binding cassette domain-containing protein, partial [Pseudomonas aeruginosa]|nr:ATP-binding cassette domain-containing protein [Pseudomonas aeruginosa]